MNTESTNGLLAARSTRIYLVVVIVLLGAWAILTVAPVDVPVEGQTAALSLAAAVAVSVLGLGGLYLTRQVGLPAMLDPSRSARERIVLPLVVGGALGVALSLLDILDPLGLPHVPWPASLAFYAYGAVFTEIALRLVPVPLAAWIGDRFGARKGAAIGFWSAAVLTSLIEPAGLVPMIRVSGMALVAAFGIAFLVNFGAAYTFWRAGFLAALLTRGAFYLIWHLIYGGLF